MNLILVALFILSGSKAKRAIRLRRKEKSRTRGISWWLKDIWLKEHQLQSFWF